MLNVACCLSCCSGFIALCTPYVPVSVSVARWTMRAACQQIGACMTRVMPCGLLSMAPSYSCHPWVSAVTYTTWCIAAAAAVRAARCIAGARNTSRCTLRCILQGRVFLASSPATRALHASNQAQRSRLFGSGIADADGACASVLEDTRARTRMQTQKQTQTQTQTCLDGRRATERRLQTKTGTQTQRQTQAP